MIIDIKIRYKVSNSSITQYIAHFPAYFMKDDYDGSHFTPDIFCPFCNQNVKKHAKDCIGKRFPFTSKDKTENSERLRKLYKKR